MGGGGGLSAALCDVYPLKPTTILFSHSSFHFFFNSKWCVFSYFHWFFFLIFWFFFLNIFFWGGRTPFPSMINMPPDTSPYHNIPIACYLAWKLFILAQPAMETVLGKHCARYYRFQLPTDDREYKHGEKVTRNKISYLLSYFARRHLRIYLSLYQASNIERVSTLNNK